MIVFKNRYTLISLLNMHDLMPPLGWLIDQFGQ